MCRAMCRPMRYTQNLKKKPLMQNQPVVTHSKKSRTNHALSQFYLHWDWNSKLNTKLRLEFQFQYRFKLEIQVELFIHQESVATCLHEINALHLTT